MIISDKLIKVDKDESINDAMELMTKKRISRLLVTEKDEVVGIITEEDIAKRLGTGRERKLKTAHIHVSAAMTRNLKTIPADGNIRDAARIMLENKFSSLPVVRNNKVIRKRSFRSYDFPKENHIIGILTKTDLVKNLIKSKKKVEKFYTKNPIMTNPADTLVSARKLMLENKIHRLLVLDRGMIAGILTERDMARGLKTFRKAIDKFPQANIRRLLVEQVMTREPITIRPETTVGEAARIMLTNKISGIPVISPEFGILTKTDLVKGIADGLLP